MHPLQCSFSAAAQQAAAIKITEELNALCDWVAATGATSPGHLARLHGIKHATFFNVLSAHCPVFEQHDKYAGAIGVLPSGFFAVLAPDQELTGPVHAVKFMRKQLPTHTLAFQLKILRETMAVYNKWANRAQHVRGIRPCTKE